MGEGVWKTSSWSDFDMLTRTNNATEGTHNKLKQSSRTPNNTFYRLENMVFNKVNNLEGVEKMVSHGKD